MVTYPGTLDRSISVTTLGDALLVTALFQPIDDQDDLRPWYAVVTHSDLEAAQPSATELGMARSFDSLLWFAADEINWTPCEQGVE